MSTVQSKRNLKTAQAQAWTTVISELLVRSGTGLHFRPGVIELFAGAGGLALGLEKAGMNVRCLIDSDPCCCETLRFNAVKYFPGARVLNYDLRRLSAGRLLGLSGVHRRDAEIVSGGPPCQSFSLSSIPKGGRRYDDPKDRLLLQFLRIVRGIAPEGFILENVPGLSSKNGGSTFSFFCRKMEKMGYKITHAVLNAADFGVPQTRRRLIVLGSKEAAPDFPFPTVKRSGLLWPKSSTISGAFSHIVEDAPNSTLPRHTPRKLQMLARLPQG